MRSVLGLAGSLVILAGVVTGLSCAILLNAGGSEILHVALGAGFVLLAISVFDFRPAVWVKVIAAVAMLLLAVIFFLQGLSDLTNSPLLAKIAYAELGQSSEKLLGYLFIAWCLALALVDSTSRSRWLGMATIVVIMGVEAYSYAMRATGGQVIDALKLLYVPVFVWLAIESGKRKDA
jgi:hypothetical protein